MASRGRSNFGGKVNKYRRTTDDDDREGQELGFGELGNNSGASKLFNDDVNEEEQEAQATSKRFAEIEERNAQDEQFGFVHYASGPSKTGWILNMKSVKLITFYFTNCVLDLCKGFGMARW